MEDDLPSMGVQKSPAVLLVLLDLALAVLDVFLQRVPVNKDHRRRIASNSFKFH